VPRGPQGGADGLWSVSRAGLTIPMVRRRRHPSHTVAPFTVPATLELLSSPKRGPLGPFPAPPRRPSVSASLWDVLTPVARRRRGTLTGQCGQPLCPGETTSHPVEPRRPTVTRAAKSVTRRPGASADSGAWHLDLGRNVIPPELVHAWPLRPRPLLTAAGCVPFLAESSSTDFRTGTAPRG
jgi:hypothetical protein